jgi:hypothetical protein
MLKPGLKRTHRSYLWAYGTTTFDPELIVVYDFAEGRGGEHARAFLGDWKVRSPATTTGAMTRCSAAA